MNCCEPLELENIFNGLLYNKSTKEILNCNWIVIGKVKQGKIYWNKQKVK